MGVDRKNRRERHEANVIPALLVAAAVLLTFSSDARARRRMQTLSERPHVNRSLNAPMIRVAFLIAGLACAFLLGGILGWAGGALIAILGPIFIGRLEPRTKRDRDDALLRQAPNVADLLAACVASGASVRDATDVVASASSEPMQRILRNVVAAMDLGAASDAAWAEVAHESSLAPIAQAVIRSSRSGAPLAELLTHIASDLRRERRLHIEVAARSAGVKAVAPLATCFLPAFLLLSVVPIVVDLGGSMLHPQG